jgi:hypothetical protein
MILLACFIIPVSLFRSLQTGSFREHFSQITVAGVLFLTIAIPLYTGGDHFGYSRFIQPTAPIVISAMILAVTGMGFRLGYFKSAVIVLFASFIPNYSHYENIYYHKSPIAVEWKIAKGGRLSSEMLNAFADKMAEYPSQGIYLAGGAAYAYKGFSNDLLGLNNIEMAHNTKEKNKEALKNHASFSKDVFYKQKPDLFWCGGGFLKDIYPDDELKLKVNAFEDALFQRIQNDTAFQKLYSPVAITKTDSDFTLMIFASNTFLQNIDTAYYAYRVIPLE